MMTDKELKQLDEELRQELPKLIIQVYAIKSHYNFKVEPNEVPRFIDCSSLYQVLAKAISCHPLHKP